jgi:hypothetical protein
MRFAVALAALIVSVTGALAQEKPLPKFKDYPVKTIYKGKGAAPKIYGETKRYYESSYTSAIRDGVTFAGEYAIAIRPCGTTCQMPDIVSVKTGKVINIPFSISGWREYHDNFEPVEVKPDSRLIVFLGARNEKLPLGYHYYVLENGKLKFLRTVENDGNFMEPLPKD